MGLWKIANVRVWGIAKGMMMKVMLKKRIKILINRGGEEFFKKWGAG